MTFSYKRFDELKRVVLTFRGAYDLTDALEAVERYGAETARTYGALLDLRAMTGLPPMADLRTIASEHSTMVRDGRGPIAFLVTDTTVYSKACTYKVIAHPDHNIEVFRDRWDAELWLSSNTH